MTFEAKKEFALVTKFGNELMTVFVKERLGNSCKGIVDITH
jgi:hypothetical protein